MTAHRIQSPTLTPWRETIPTCCIELTCRPCSSTSYGMNNCRLAINQKRVGPSSQTQSCIRAGSGCQTAPSIWPWPLLCEREWPLAILLTSKTPGDSTISSPEYSDVRQLSSGDHVWWGKTANSWCGLRWSKPSGITEVAAVNIPRSCSNTVLQTHSQPEMSNELKNVVRSGSW